MYILWKCQDWSPCRSRENRFWILKQKKFVNEQKWARISKIDEVPFNSLTNFYCVYILWISPSKRGFSAPIFVRYIDYTCVYILWKCQDWSPCACRSRENRFWILKQYKFVNEQKWARISKIDEVPFNSLTNFYCVCILWISPSKRGFSAPISVRYIDYSCVYILWTCQDWSSCRSRENRLWILKQ